MRDLELIKTGDVVIDTTGFGGLNVEQSSEINAEVFLIEDPVAEDNDSLLKDKNNIHERINAINASNKDQNMKQPIFYIDINDVIVDNMFGSTVGNPKN